MNIIRPTTVGDGGSFSRAGTKQCIGADGLLQTVPVDVPAWQYDPLNLSAAPVALLEGAATNLLLWSSDPTNAAWAKGSNAIYVGVTDGPYGMSAKRYSAGGAGNCSITQFASVSPSTAYSVVQGVRLPSGVVSGSTLVFFYDGVGAFISFINFEALSAVSGWQENKVLFTTPSNCAQVKVHFGVVDPSAGYLFDLAYIQFARGAVTSYIPTTAVAATRAADIITGTGLIWSNAPETAPAAYAGGTTYAKYAQVSVAGAAGLITVYQSMQAVNIDHTPGSSPTWWTVVGTTYQVYSALTSYALGDIVIDPVEHQTYQSVWPSAHTGIALSDGTHWFNGGANSRWSTNKWAAFDDVVGTAVTLPGRVLMLIVPGAIDCVGLLNVGGSSASIGMTDPVSMTRVFKKAVDLTNDTSITDYDAYFFDEGRTVSDLYTDGLPPYYSGVMSIALVGPGDVSLGVAKFGNSFDLGGARYGLRVGFISYSKKVTDDDGSTSVKKGAVSKRMTVTTMIDNANLDKTQQVMGDLDGVPTVIVGVGNLYTSLIQFCFVKEFDTEIAYPTNSLCSFQTEGLI
jgi:hypothetical protein